MSGLLLGVDGGNSKTHLALARTDGTLLSAVAGPSISHQAVGMETGMRRLGELVGAAMRRADLSRSTMAESAGLCLAGADLPGEVRMLRRSIDALRIARRLTITNDVHAALRAGASRGWGVAVICGAGVNCVGRTPDGRTGSFPGLGDIAGDWGGGSGVGMAGLQAAIRGRDRRGAHTALERSVPAHFGLRRPIDVTYQLYRGEIQERALGALSPVVFKAARGGDAVARAIVDRLADELATMAVAMLRRLRLVRSDAEVILAGGIFASRDAALLARIAQGIHAVAPRAQVRTLDGPPVLGALLLALDGARVRDPKAVEKRLRAQPLRPQPAGESRTGG